MLLRFREHLDFGRRLHDLQQAKENIPVVKRNIGAGTLKKTVSIVAGCQRIGRWRPVHRRSGALLDLGVGPAWLTYL